jgi:hypothetical protein
MTERFPIATFSERFVSDQERQTFILFAQFVDPFILLDFVQHQERRRANGLRVYPRPSQRQAV